MAEVTEMFSAPLTFNWTLSYKCNFACEHCYSRDEECPELATDEIKQIVDVLVEQQVPFINFGGGEPLIRQDLFEVASYASQRGLNVSMNTNGWLLDESAARRLKESGFSSVGISIDSSEAALHDDEVAHLPLGLVHKMGHSPVVDAFIDRCLFIQVAAGFAGAEITEAVGQVVH